MFEDIPPPQEVVLTADQRYRRHRRFAVVLNWFVLGYSFLHKFLMPLIVARFSTWSTAVYHVDEWWLYHVVLFFLLIRKKWDDVILRFFLLFGLGGVLLQIVAGFLEYNWHTVSLWVTSGAALALIVFLFSFSRYRLSRGYGVAFLGIVSGAVVQFALFGFSLHSPGSATNLKQGTSATVDASRYRVLTGAAPCGLGQFSVSLESLSLLAASSRAEVSVDVLECGFSTALALFPREEIVLRNKTAGYLNVKLYFPMEEKAEKGKGRWEAFQNIPLLPQSVRAIPQSALREHPFVLVASDSDPKKGIMLLVRDEKVLMEWSERSKAGDDPSKMLVRVDRSFITLSF